MCINKEIKSCPNCGCSTKISTERTAIISRIKCTACGYTLGINTTLKYVIQKWNHLSAGRENLFKPPLIYYKTKR